MAWPFATSAAPGDSNARRPNFLIVLADDCTYNDLPVYGGQNAHTPNIDSLASQGLVFNRAYPSRTVFDGHWRYIRNLTPNELYIQKYLMGIQGNGGLNNPYWATWLFTSEANPNTYRLIKRYMMRPAEELYDTAADPYEMTNRVADPKLADTKARLSAELDRWLAEQGDPGAPVDPREALQAAKAGEHKYFAKP